MRRYAPRILLLLTLLLYAGLATGVRGAPPAEQPKPSIVFNLTLSLEWQPGSGDSLPADLALAGCKEPAAADYLADLEQGLRSTAAYLYTYSEGQLALGKVTVYTGGANWDQADIRVLADNAYRPTTLIGGIVDRPTRYISATTSISRTVFYPGSIMLSRLWNRYGSRCGPWSQPDGWRTIGHEWGHYALFLYDEYFNMVTGARQYCTTTGIDFTAVLSTTNSAADSLMAYPYSTDKLWLGGGGLPPACVGTPQEHIHGVSDWEALPRFYAALTVPTSLRTDLDFETSPAKNLFSVTVAPPATARADTSAEVRVNALPLSRLVGNAYVLRLDSKGNIQRIIGQGKLIPGESVALPFWGVQPDTNDRAAVLIQDWRTGARFFFPKSYNAAPALNVAAPNLLDAPASQWRPAMTIKPRVTTIGQFSEVTGLTVQIKDCAGVAKSRILLTYCPAGGDCGDSVIVSINGGAFTHTFSFPFDGQYEPPASYGYIYARNLDTSAGPPEETIGWYQLAGGVGPPAYGDGFAPLAEGMAETALDPGQALPGPDTRLLYSSAQSCTGDFRLPLNVLGIVDTPLTIQPVVANDANGNGGRGWGEGFTDPALRVRLRYNQELLDRLAIDERQLVVLRLDAGQRAWQELPAIGRSTELDWIMAQKQAFGGQGEVYALGYRRVQVALPLMLR